MASVKGDKEEDFEILDLTKKNSIETTFKRVFGDVTKASAAKQVAVGGATGWISGYVAIKVGKAAAVTIAATCITVQVAQYNGLISINWAKVNQAVRRIQCEAEKNIQKRRNSILKAAHQFYQDNFFLGAGFAGGFFIGFFL